MPSLPTASWHLPASVTPRVLNSVIVALERVEEVLAALILSSEPDDIETRATVLRLADFRNLSRSMRRIS